MKKKIIIEISPDLAEVFFFGIFQIFYLHDKAKIQKI